MLPQIIYYYGLLILTLSSCWSIGFVLLKVKNVKLSFCKHQFASTIIGTLLITTTYAIIHTQGKTVLSILAVFCLLFWITYRKNIKKKLEDTNQPKSIVLFTSIFLFTTLAFFLFNTLTIIKLSGKFPYYIPTLDLVGYANYVDLLRYTAQENYNGFSANYFDSYFHGSSPYHFYEFWLAALVSQIFGSQAIMSYWIITYPLFYITIWLGLLAVAEDFGYNISAQLAVFCASLLFIGAIYLPIYQLIPYLESTFYLHNNSLLTYGVIEPLLIAIFLLYRHKQYLLGNIAILVLPILSITTLAGVIGFFIGLFLLKNKYNLRITIFLPIVFLLISLFLFYYFFGTQNTATFSWREWLPVYAFQQLPFIAAILLVVKGLASVFGLYVFKTFLVYLPWLLLIGWHLQQIKSNLISKASVTVLLPLFFICVLSLGAMYIFFLHHDSSQLFRNIVYPIFNISTCILLIYFIYYNKGSYAYINKNYNKIVKFFIFIFIIYQFYFSITFRYQQVKERQVYSETYLETIAQIEPDKLSSSMGGFIYGKDFYTNDLFSRTIRHQLPAGYLAVLPHFHTVVNLEIFSIPPLSESLAEKLAQRFLTNSEFYQFVQRQKEQNKFISISESQLAFINKHRLGYLILGKNVPTPEGLLIQKEIIDSLSGERFLLLHPK